MKANYANYIFVWLFGYSGFLGPIAGVLICDYFIVRKKLLIVEDLYQRNGRYEYSRGFNWTAVASLAAGAGVAFIGLAASAPRAPYHHFWLPRVPARLPSPPPLSNPPVTLTPPPARRRTPC